MKNIIKYVSSKGRFISDNEIIESAFWFNMSMLTGFVHKDVLYRNELTPINYFGITIASSSAGKSFAYNETRNLFKDFFSNEKFSKYIHKRYKELNPKPIKVMQDRELSEYIPDNVCLNIDGTTEGLYMRAMALNASHCGSLNLLNEEILDIVTKSNMDTTKELYDGRFNAKVTKMDINHNLDGLYANMLVFGSPIGIKKDINIYKSFDKQLSSGVYRRSFIYYSDPKPFTLNNKEDTIHIDLSYLDDFIKDSLKNSYPILISDNSYKFIKFIENEILEFANDNLNDNRYSAELGSVDKIIKLSALHAIYKQKTTIEEEDLKYAYDFYIRCRNTVSSLFCTTPQHTRFYNIIKSKSNITKSEIFEKDIFNASSWNDDINMVIELAYRYNEQLIVKGKAIKKYSIEPLPRTNLDKIIVSIDTSKKGRFATNYKPLEIPFFGDKPSIEKLVISDEIDSFCACHFEPNQGNPEGYRNEKNFIQGQNLIVFDFDEGNRIEEIVEIFKDYTYILYTTSSHTEEKHKFRLVIPTKSKFFVDVSQHKTLYENIAETFQLKIYDKSCRNAGRLFYTQNTKRRKK